MTVGECIRAAVTNYKLLHPLYSPRIAVAQEVGVSCNALTKYILDIARPTDEILENIFQVCDDPEGLKKAKAIRSQNT